MKPAIRFYAGAGLLLVVLALATLAYMVVEDMDVLDAVYMTVITVSTVGFREVGRLSAGGQLLTIVVILLGVGTVLYTAGAAFELAIENLFGGRRRLMRMQRAIEEFSDHYIVCGYGRVGSHTWMELREETNDVVVIESNPTRAAQAREDGAYVVEGDATSDEALTAAGVDKAAALVACVRNDSENLVIVLSAKARRPGLLVVARATEPEWETKLRLAGADKVVAPQVLGAHRLAALSMRPELAEFLDLVVRGRTVEFNIEQINVQPGCELAGKSLREAAIREKAGAMVLAMGDTDGRLLINPHPDTVVTPGQVVVGIGTMEQVEALKKLVAPD